MTRDHLKRSTLSELAEEYRGTSYREYKEMLEAEFERRDRLAEPHDPDDDLRDDELDDEPKPTACEGSGCGKVDRDKIREEFRQQMVDHMEEVQPTHRTGTTLPGVEVAKIQAAVEISRNVSSDYPVFKAAEAFLVRQFGGQVEPAKPAASVVVPRGVGYEPSLPSGRMTVRDRDRGHFVCGNGMTWVAVVTSCNLQVGQFVWSDPVKGEIYDGVGDVVGRWPSSLKMKEQAGG